MLSCFRCSWLPSVLVALVFLSLASFANDTPYRGRVLDAVSGDGIEGTRISLDKVPTDGIAEFEIFSDAFGFFTFPSIDLDEYELTAHHNAYLDETQIVNIATVNPEPIEFMLTPILGEFLDLFVQVSGVTSGLGLEHVPVAISRFDSPSATVPVQTIVATTDSEGHLAMRGLAPGYYRLRANDPMDGAPRPKWLPYTTQNPADPSLDKVFLSDTHFAYALLKPVLQSVTFQVTGFDPVQNAESLPLANAVVEITGVDWDPLNSMAPVLPVRTQITNAEGKVTFSKLPAIHYRVQVKKPGYEPTVPETIIEPDMNGDFIPGNDLTNPIPLSLNLLFNQLYLYLHSPYQEMDPLILFGLNVHLQGLKGTATEGIQRFGAVAENFDQRFFANLIPGKYRLSVDGQANNTFFPVRPYFSGEGYVDVAEGQWTDAHLTLDVAPAIIRGRLFAADASAEISADPSSSGPPIYQPKQQIDINFIEKEVDPLLPLGYRTVSVDSDEDGNFSLEILPSLYGIQIAGMNDYFGSHIRLINQTTEISSEMEITQGWPFYQSWPKTFEVGFPPSNGTGNFGVPIVFRSKQEYQLDLFVNRQRNSITGTVLNDPADPTPGDLVWAAEGMATLTSAKDGTPLTAPFDSASGNNGRYIFRDLPPGTYTISVQHPRNTFSYDGSATPFEVTLSPWQAPGVLPMVDPHLRVGEEPLKTMALPPAQASYTPSTTSLTFNYWNWNGTDYDASSGPQSFTHKQVAYTGDVIFSGGTPVGPFTFWVRLFGCGSPAPFYESRVTAEGTVETHDIYCGGPLDTNILDLPAVPVIQNFRIVSASDPTFFVEDTTVHLDGEPSILVSIQDQPFGFTQPVTITGADNDNWVFVNSETRLIDPFNSEYLTTVRMGRATNVRGSVAAMTTKKVSNGIEKAVVQVKDRFGNILRETQTDSEGEFNFAVALPGSAPIFVDIQAQGFIPFRQRIAPDDSLIIPDPMNPLEAVLNIAATLTPIPSPAVGLVSLDRAGLFLSGTKAFGDQNGLTTDPQAEALLTLTFEVNGTAPSFTLDLPGFDLPSGDPSPQAMEHITDPIAEIWLIDPRQFPGQTTPTGFIPGNPYSDPPQPLVFPADDDYQAVRTFLDELGGSNASGVAFTKASFLETQFSDQAFVGRGSIPLWDLPPGDFNPVLVILSERGAISISPITYTGPLAGRELKGAILPPWLAFVGEVLHVVANTPEFLKDAALRKITPEGRYRLRPEFSVEIKADPMNPGFLNYDYTLGISVREGLNTPASSYLGYAPGTLGLQLNATAFFKVKGKEQRLDFGVSGNAGTENDIDLSDYLPKRLFGLKVENPSVRPNIEVTTAFSEILDASNPLESQLTHEVTGSAVASLELNLNRLTSKIPSMGPIFTALDRTQGLQFFATLSGASKLTSRTSWNTRRPSAGSTTLDHEPRTHIFGGNEDVTPPPNLENIFRLDFNLGVGLRAKALKGIGKATASLNLQGEEVRFPGEPDPLPVVEIEVNPAADWPFLTRISGTLTAKLEASLDLTLFEISKTWEWDLLEFKHEFGTEETQKRAPMVDPFFQWVPLMIDTKVTGPNPVLFSGNEPQIIDDFMPTGSYALAKNTAPGLLFTDWDDQQNTMTLNFSQKQSDGSWSTPEFIGEAPAVVEVALTALADNRWLAVWSEISDSQLNQAFPDHILFFSLGSSDGLVWSAPQQIAALSGQAHQLKLVSNATSAGLVFLASNHASVGDTFAIQGIPFDGMVWGSVQELHSELGLLAFDAHGGGNASMESTQVLLTKLNGDVEAFAWDGTSTTAVEPVTAEASGSHATFASPLGHFYSVIHRTGEGFELFERQPGNTWQRLATLPLQSHPSDVGLVLLTDATLPALHLSWLTSGSENGLNYMLLDLQGAILESETGFVKATAGTYEDLQVIACDSRNALLSAQFSHPQKSLRMFPFETEGFQFSPIAGLVVSEDGLQDAFEVKLSQTPTDTVIVTLVPELSGEIQLDPATLVFTPENGTQPIQVTVNGISDGVIDGNQTLVIQTGDVTSNDPFFMDFSGNDLADIQVTVLDDGVFALPQSFLDQMADWPQNTMLDLVEALNNLASGP